MYRWTHENLTPIDHCKFTTAARQRCGSDAQNDFPCLPWLCPTCISPREWMSFYERELLTASIYRLVLETEILSHP